MFPFVENKFNFADIIYMMQRGKDSSLAELVKRIVCMATLDGAEVKPQTFDFKYSNDLILVHKVFAFVLEVNFLDFSKKGSKSTHRDDWRRRKHPSWQSRRIRVRRRPNSSVPGYKILPASTCNRGQFSLSFT